MNLRQNSSADKHRSAHLCSSQQNSSQPFTKSGVRILVIFMPLKVTFT